MVFTLLIASEDRERNLEVNFPSRPSMQVLAAKTEALFGSGTGGVIRFQMQTRSGSGGGGGAWDDLTRPEQLSEYCQLVVVRSSPRHQQQQQQQPTSPTALNHSRAASTSTTSRLSHQPATSEATAPAPAPAAATAASQQRATGGDQASTEPVPDKAAWVFQALAGGERARAVPRAAFLDAVLALAPALRDDAPRVFERCDADADGALDPSEFRALARAYPALLDALFLRLRGAEQGRFDREGLRETAEEVAAREGGEAAAAAAHAEAQGRTAQLDGGLRRQAEALARSHKREQAAKKAHEETRAAVHARRSALQDAVLRGDALAEDAAQCAASIARADGEAAAQHRALAEASEARDEAEARLAELQRLAEAAQAAAAEAAAGVAAAAATLQAANARQGEAAARAEALAEAREEAGRAVGDLEEDVGAAVEAERAALSRHRDASNDVAREQAKRDLLERELEGSRDGEARRRGDERAAREAAAAARQRAERMRAAAEDGERRRRRAQAEGARIVQQEVRLRGQKDELERVEASLRTEQQQYASLYDL